MEIPQNGLCVGLIVKETFCSLFDLTAAFFVEVGILCKFVLFYTLQ